MTFLSNFGILPIFGHKAWLQKVSPWIEMGWELFLVILMTQYSTFMHKISLIYDQVFDLLKLCLIRPKITNWPIN